MYCLELHWKDSIFAVLYFYFLQTFFKPEFISDIVQETKCDCL